MTEHTWPEVEARLSAAVTGLADDGFVVLGEPPAPPGEPSGLLRRRPPPAATRFTQVVRHGEFWHAECVGATSFGGAWPVDAAQHEQLREAGWSAPGDPDDTGTQPAAPVYWRTLPVGDPTQVVDLMTRALQVLGLTPASLAWDER